MNLSLIQPMIIWLCVNLFFAFQFILRLSTGVLREEISQKFLLDASSFGTLAGCYYLGYAGMQIPIGIMLDRFAFKKVTFAAIFATSIGSVIFSISDNFHILLLGRFLIGAGSAIGFLSIAKITKIYFDVKYHSLLLGFAFTFGLLGAVFGITIINSLYKNFGYDHSFQILSAIALIIGAIILLLPIKIDQNNNESNNITSIFTLLFNPKLILIGISGGLMVGALEGFADVWSIPFFKQIYKMSNDESNLATSCIYIGMCFGGPLLAILANYFKNMNIMVIITAICTIFIFTILLYFPEINFTYTSILMFCLGIVCCYQALIFSIVTNMVEARFEALAVAIVNCINMSFGHFFHKMIGFLMTYNATTIPSEIFTRQDFIVALISIPICAMIGVLGFIYFSISLKKTCNNPNC